MESYRNLGRISEVVAYEKGMDFIRVKFNDGSIYLYTDTSTGAENIKHMKQLATEGIGLHRFITTTVHRAYACKER